MRAGNDFLWRQNKSRDRIRVPLHQATSNWVRKNEEMFEEADYILIENQYHTRGAMQTFRPMIVMDNIAAISEFKWPGKMDLCHPQAVKARFKISGTYEQRKREVEVRFKHFLPDEVARRSHDALDAMLNAWWWLERKNVPNPPEAEKSVTAEEIREAVREQHELKPKARPRRRTRAF